MTFGAGFYGAAGLEAGDYYHFRRDSDRRGLADNSTSPLYAMASVYPHIGFPAGGSTRVTLQAAVGTSGGISPLLVISRKSRIIWFALVSGHVGERNPLKYPPMMGLSISL